MDKCRQRLRPRLEVRSFGPCENVYADEPPDGQVQNSGSGASSGMTACMTDGTLEMTLEGGVLKDSKGRTGYIVCQLPHPVNTYICTVATPACFR